MDQFQQILSAFPFYMDTQRERWGSTSQNNSSSNSNNKKDVIQNKQIQFIILISYTNSIQPFHMAWHGETNLSDINK